MAIAIEVITALLTVAGLVYMVIALRAVRSFALAPTTHTTATPNISLLKPMKGSEPGMYEALRTQCLQHYAGQYEIIFGVQSLTDPAVAEIERLRAEFPSIVMQLVECPQRLGTSGKVSNLVQMLPHAHGEVLVVNDSDIHVSPRYLTQIANTLAQPGPKKVGLVTAPYFGRCAAPATLWGKLEALGIATEFFPSALTARMLEGGIRFGLGSTLAMSREALEAIGGFVPLVEYLADDYELGARIAGAGYRVELFRDVVATTVPRYNFRDFWNHQLRWSRCVRDSRKAGYIGLCVTYVLPWALASCLASGGALWSFTLLSLALLARFALALTAGVGILGDRQVMRDLWLVPLRDCVALVLWVWSYAGNTIVWRGEKFHLKDGKLVR